MAVGVFVDNGVSSLNAAVTTTPAAGTIETWTFLSLANFPQIGNTALQQYWLTVGPTTDTKPEVVAVVAHLTATTASVVRGQGSDGVVKTHAVGDPVIATLPSAALQLMMPQPGDLRPTAALNLPTGWVLCDGSAYSRNTYAALWSALSLSQLGTTTNGSNAITGITSTALMGVGMPITAPGLALTGVTITGITSGTSVTVSANAGAGAGTGTVTVAPHGMGDGSTTFNVPDLRGRGPIGSGTGSGLTARTLGVAVGAETVSHSHTVSATHTHGSAAHTHTMGNHVHADATHQHNLTGNGYAELSWGAAGQISLIRNANGSWTSTSKSTSSTAVPLTGDSTAQTGVVPLGGITETAAGTTSAPSPNTSDSTTPGSTGSASAGSTDTTTPSIMQPSLPVNWMIKT